MKTQSYCCYTWEAIIRDSHVTSSRIAEDWLLVPCSPLAWHVYESASAFWTAESVRIPLYIPFPKDDDEIEELGTLTLFLNQSNVMGDVRLKHKYIERPLRFRNLTRWLSSVTVFWRTSGAVCPLVFFDRVVWIPWSCPHTAWTRATGWPTAPTAINYK